MGIGWIVIFTTFSTLACAQEKKDRVGFGIFFFIFYCFIAVYTS